MATSQTWVVSPYLQLLPRDITAAMLRRPDNPLLRKRPRSCRMSRNVDELCVLYDVLELRAVVTSLRNRDHLAGIRRHGAVTEAQASVPRDLFCHFVDLGLLLPESQVCRRHAYRSIEIEINRHCNFRCSFCPVARTPKPRGFMSDDVFTIVLDRVEEYGAHLISLNHYSEPGLDPTLLTKIERAVAKRLIVRLHTNLSLLSEDKVRALARIGRTEVVVNLPSVDRATHEEVTGAKLYDRVMENLGLLHRYGVPTQLSVNAPKPTGKHTLAQINERLAGMFGTSALWATDDRAGRLESNEYAEGVAFSGRLGGCAIAAQQLNVTYAGEAFLCCQDFDQEHILGDLKNQTIREIAEGEDAIRIRRWLLGFEPPPTGFICSRCDWTRPYRANEAQLSLGNPRKAPLEIVPFRGDVIWLEDVVS